MSEDHLPTAEFRVLLSLLDAPRHGHGIRLDVRESTDGRVDMGPGTLYGAIKRLHRRGWIQEVDPPRGEEGDGRRRFYQVTAPGREAAKRETVRLRELVELARERGAPAGP